MPLPWKKPRSGRISRFVADLQQSPKRGGSLVVETGFPTSLIDLFVKNRDRLKKPSSKRRQSASPVDPPPSPPRSSSPPPPLTRRSSFPPPLAPLPPPREEPLKREVVASNKIEERISSQKTPVCGGAWVLMLVVKVFIVGVLALSTKKLTVGIMVSTFVLLFLEFAAPRVFTCFKLCPNAMTRLDSITQKIVGMRTKEKTVAIDDENMISCEITEIFEDSMGCTEGIRVPESCTNTVSWSEPEAVVIPEKKSWELPAESSVVSKRAKAPAEGGEVQTIRDLVFINERSKSSKLKSKIVKKFKSSMKKKKSMKIKEEKEKMEEETGGGSLTEVSSIVSDDKSEKMGSEISEMGDDYSNPPLLESCTEVEESRVESHNVIVLFVMVLVGLLGGKVLAVALFLFWCLILRFAGKSKAPYKNLSDDV